MLQYKGGWGREMYKNPQNTGAGAAAKRVRFFSWCSDEYRLSLLRHALPELKPSPPSDRQTSRKHTVLSPQGHPYIRWAT